MATIANLECGFAVWVTRIENELADVCSLDPYQRQRAIGRAQGPVFVQQPAMGQVETGDTRVQPVTSAWQILTSWRGQVQQALCAWRVQQSRAAPMDVRHHHPLHTVARVKARLGLHDWGYLGTGVLAAEFRCWLAGIDSKLL